MFKEYKKTIQILKEQKDILINKLKSIDDDANFQTII